uniref:histone acetyltransferase n=1 Tax=Myotis lucifugus TaxID=59463 RepID=G1Q7H0_MYOLU
MHEDKESSLAMLLQVHSQGQDGCVLACTECKQRVETGWHCPCQDYDLCINCYNTKGHTHKMVKVGLGLDEEAEEAEEGDEGGNQGEMQLKNLPKFRRLSILRCIQSLRHARQCGDTNCSDCQKLKRVVLHTTRCLRKAFGGCPVCKQLFALCCYHAKQCQENPCPPFCLNIKQKLREQRLRRRQQRIGNRLLQADATMNSCNVPQPSAIPSAPPWTPPQQPNTPQTPQPPTQSQPWPVSMSLAGFFSSALAPPVSTGKPTNLQLQPSLQNLKAMQASGPRPAVPPQQQMGGLNPKGQALNIMNPGRNPSMARMNNHREMPQQEQQQEQQEQQQQQEGSAGMAAGLGHAQFQQPQQQQIQQQIGSQASQTVLGPNSAQFFLLSQLEAPVLSAVSCYSHFRCHRRQLSRSEQVRQKIKKHGPNTPHEPQQHMLSESHRPLLPGQQMAICLSSQVRSQAPVPSRLQSQPPHSSPSPWIPQPSPHHLSPQTGSPHPGLPVTMASSIDQGHLGNPKYTMLPQLNTPRSALPSELSLIGDTTIDTLEKFV